LRNKGSPVHIKIAEDAFTDRGHGEGLVLSEYRSASGAGECKHAKAYCVHTTGNGCMKCKLLGMCQNISHVYKQIVN